MSAQSSVIRMLEVFDVAPESAGIFVGTSDGGNRRVVDGTQLLSQSIVAVAKCFPDRSVRSAHATFTRGVDPDIPVHFNVVITHAGRSMAGALVTVRQGERTCAVVTVLADIPGPDLIRHQSLRPDVAGPEVARPCPMPMVGRDLRLVDVRDINSPTETGPPQLYAWLRYALVPERGDLAKALLAHFTGHLSISASMRPHAGIGTGQAHRTVSTAVMTVTVCFHEPVRWDGWLLYSHDSVYTGAGMSYVRGSVHTEQGQLIASFTQEGLIRSLRASDAAVPTASRL